MSQDLLMALNAIEKERGIEKEILFEAIEVALMSAYKRNFNHATNARIEINRDTGQIKVFRAYEVVDSIDNVDTEIMLEKARELQPEIEVGEIIETEVTPRDFGRIAAQTAKQVVIQRIREAERELIYEKYVDRIGDVTSGTVQRFEQKNILIDLDRAEAILPPMEQIPNERFRQGEIARVYILDVKKTNKGPQIIVSRSHAVLLKRLFEMEVPEIYDGVIEIKAVAREAGHRSKIAVTSKNRDVDPVGACVGQKGSRVQSVSNELRGEKIDIIQWSDNQEEFIMRALSPAKVNHVELNAEEKIAKVVVPDNQLSLSIGREGQNVRLAAKITGWKVDILSESQLADELPGTEELDGAVAEGEEAVEAVTVEEENRELPGEGVEADALEGGAENEVRAEDSPLEDSMEEEDSQEPEEGDSVQD